MPRFRFRTRPAWAPDDGAGGGAPAPAADVPATANETAKTEAPAAGGEGSATPPATASEPRPEWLPEGLADGPALAKSYAELRAAYSSKEEKLREKVLADLRKDAPAKPEDYAFEVDPAALPAGFQIVPPEPDDPMLTTARAVMHELGATPAQWQKLTTAFVGWQVSQQPNVEAERAKLGEGGEARLAAVDAWLGRHLPEDAYRGLVADMRTAPSILALERLMKLATENGFTVGGGAAAPATGASMTPAQLSEVLSHPDYYHETKGADLRARASAAIRAGVRPVGMRA